MSSAGIKAASYCLNHAPELALHYGNTPWVERITKPESEFLAALPKHMQSYEQAARYAPNLAYTGAIHALDLDSHPKPWLQNLMPDVTRNGSYGEIMPEDEFLGLMDICDVFDLVWLEKEFAARIKPKLAVHPLLGEAHIARLEAGHDVSEIEAEARDNGALTLYMDGAPVGCVRRGHDLDENLIAYVLLENIASKASAVLALLHLLANAGMKPEEVDFVVECSEEAIGDMNQRGGGNMAKAVAEIAGCVNASGFDVRGFCAAPVDAMICAASMVAGGARHNVAVVAGGAVPKLYMNSRDHVKKGLPAMEDCIGSFAVMLVPDDGNYPVMRLDALGKHTVGAGASPQAVTQALVYEPLQTLGLKFADIDKYAAELHIPEITLPAGAGDVPTANFKMIAALAVMKGQLEKSAMGDFVAVHGIPGFAHTQGHIPSGVPFVGHAADAIKQGRIKRAMIIGKGSLFLGRMTNLSDGASFIMEASSGGASGSVTKDDIKQLLFDALSEIAAELRK